MTRHAARHPIVTERHITSAAGRRLRLTQTILKRPWIVTLPSGARVRGRRLSDPVSPADFALILAHGPVPAWPHRRIRWPDFWIPTNIDEALDALHDAHHRARVGERVEAACRGGVGRTGTALAALAILDGLTPPDALSWVRSTYDRRAVDTPWQRRWLQAVH
jgi:hypothetical protein